MTPMVGLVVVCLGPASWPLLGTRPEVDDGGLPRRNWPTVEVATGNGQRRVRPCSSPGASPILASWQTQT